MRFRSCRPGGRHLRLMALVFLMAAACAFPAAAATTEECLVCHSDATLTMDRAGRKVPLHVDGAKLAGSAHKDLSCTDCHEGFNAEELPHKKRIAPVGCLSCHDGVADKHAFHPKIAEASGTNGEPPISCKRCHGTHEVKPLAAPDSPFHPSRITQTCGKCHVEVAAHLKASAHGASGVPGAPNCLSCHEKPITPLRAGGASAELKLAQEKICLDCHLDNPEIRARMGPDAGFIAAYGKSVHGAALLAGNGKAATCIDCHGSHEMARGADPGARVSKGHIPQTCAACHAGIAAEYGASVHAAAVLRGNQDAPVCTDCHGEHDILNHLDPNAPVAAGNVSAKVCSPCHSSVKMSQKYGIATDRFKTFSDSYHGLALKSGSLEAANCASCHGAHAIRSSSDPQSTVNKANLAVTCGNCHPGANERFAVGQVHVQMTEEKEPLLYWIATGYLVLIVTTVGGMFAHNALDFTRKSIRKLRIRQGLIEEEPVGHALYPRMTLNERFQHASLMLSFLLLVVTGFMLSYPDAWWVAGIRSLSDNVFDMRSLMHRIAAVVMVAASLYHILYLGFTARGRQLLRDLLPGPRDVRDALRTMAWLLGLAREKPRFGRFGYVEKAEYWALVWGTIVMGVTGAIMWFENTFIGLLTKLGYDVARTVHFYEAWLAALAILVWHVYFVVFNPDVYPMNSAWLTGKLTEAEMAEEHALELEAIKRKEEPPEQES